MRRNINEGALTSLTVVLMKGFSATRNLSLFMNDGGCEGFKYQKEMIKRDGISLAEVQKRQNGASL